MRSRGIVLVLGLACAAAGNAVGPPDADAVAATWRAAGPTEVVIDLRAGERSSLRHQLNVATGNTGSAPMSIARALRAAVSSGTAPDEIYWDAFELCGDGTVDDASEQCDRTDLAGATCMTQGFMDGTLGCTKSCQFDLSQCSGACPVTCITDADCGSCGPCLPFVPGMGFCAF